MKTSSLLVFLAFAIVLRAQDRPQFVWQGQVDGAAILHLVGKSLAVQVEKGAPVERQKFHFTDPLPQTQQQVRLQVLEGRGYVHVVDQPNIENGYSVAVEIEDPQPGSSFYSIALFWDTSNNQFESSAKTDRIIWTGRVDEAVIVSCHKQICVSKAEEGASVAGERFEFSRPLPERDADVRLEFPAGRGEIRLIEQPRKSNNYTARVSIRDPLAGAGDYSFTLAWNRVGKKESKDAAEIPEPTGRAFVWSGTVDGRVRVTLKSGASFSEVLQGAPVRGEHAEMIRPLPARSDVTPTIHKLRGRGQVSIVESPSDKNNYQLVFEIDDPEPGADDYEVELDW